MFGVHGRSHHFRNGRSGRLEAMRQQGSYLRYTSRDGNSVATAGADPLGDIAGYYSITSSARARSVLGTVRPSALAVLRLRTKSNFVGCSTGISAGFSPLRMRATYALPRRRAALMLSAS